MSEHSLQIIARIHNDFPEKFGVPHQSGWLKEQKAQIIFEPEYRMQEAFRGIEEYDYIWLIWQFSEAVEKGWSPTVRPPRLGECAEGCFCHQISFSPKSSGAVLRPSGKGGAASQAGNHTSRIRC